MGHLYHGYVSHNQRVITDIKNIYIYIQFHTDVLNRLATSGKPWGIRPTEEDPTCQVAVAVRGLKGRC